MKVLIAGDYVPCERVATALESGDYSCLEEVFFLIQNVEYSIVNLECPVVTTEAKPIYKAGPNLKCSERAVECLHQTGFHCLTLANNHFLDYGSSGVEDTLIACEKYGISHVGGGRNSEEAAKIHYFHEEGHTLAIINCCEHEYSIATSTSPGSNPLNIVKQFYAIREARKNADKVLVIVHGGYEMCQLPLPRMVETYRFFIDAGADAVVNHHQHCFSAYEVWNGKPIFYGLGNFCFDRKGQENTIWNEGYMVTLDLSNDSFLIHPYVQCSDEPKVKLLKQDAYNNRLLQLNEFVQDEQRLKKEIELFFDSKKHTHSRIFEPILNSKWLSLIRRGWVPSLISKERILQADNYVRCESLRDGLLYYLSDKENKI